MDPWLQQNLVCPRTHERLARRSDSLVSPSGHTYPIIDEIPIMLLDEEAPTNPIRFANTREQVEDPLLRPPERELAEDEIDPYVRENIVATCGSMYRSCGGRLQRYPIPEFLLPPTDGDRLLDIGSGWGRWSIAAARQGYQPVGIDPSIDRVRTARRVSRQVGAEAIFLVADGRHLPFAEDTFDAAFSFGVLQHLSKPDVRKVLPNVRRVLKSDGVSLIQMATLWGLHNPWSLVKRTIRGPNPFMVRYWSQRELQETFDEMVGHSEISASAFFTLNAQPNDLEILPWRFRTVVRTSERLRLLSETRPWVRRVADSVLIRSRAS